MCRPRCQRLLVIPFAIMLSPFQAQKIRYLFTLNDRDGDGYISHGDHVGQCDVFAEACGWASDAPRASAHREMLEGVWGMYLSAADPEDGPRVSEAAWMRLWTGFLAGVEAERASGSSATMDALLDSVIRLFAILDERGTGRADAALWCAHMASLGVRNPQAAFARIDVEGKGYLTAQDCARLQAEFLLSESPGAPGNHYFGVLPDVGVAV